MYSFQYVTVSYVKQTLTMVLFSNPDQTKELKSTIKVSIFIKFKLCLNMKSIILLAEAIVAPTWQVSLEST